jgi:hypothetical protein
VLAGRGRWLGGGPKTRARSRGPGCSFLFLFLFAFVFVVFVLSGASGEASPAGHGQEAVFRCIYAMAAKRPYAI